MHLKTSKVTRKVNELNDTDEFTIAFTVTGCRDQQEAEEVRRTVKLAIIGIGGQTQIDR